MLNKMDRLVARFLQLPPCYRWPCVLPLAFLSRDLLRRTSPKLDGKHRYSSESCFPDSDSSDTFPRSGSSSSITLDSSMISHSTKNTQTSSESAFPGIKLHIAPSDVTDAPSSTPSDLAGDLSIPTSPSSSRQGSHEYSLKPNLPRKPVIFSRSSTLIVQDLVENCFFPMLGIMDFALTFEVGRNILSLSLIHKHFRCWVAHVVLTFVKMIPCPNDSIGISEKVIDTILPYLRFIDEDKLQSVLLLLMNAVKQLPGESK